jgi:hypothetical protein
MLTAHKQTCLTGLLRRKTQDCAISTEATYSWICPIQPQWKCSPRRELSRCPRQCLHRGSLPVTYHLCMRTSSAGICFPPNRNGRPDSGHGAMCRCALIDSMCWLLQVHQHFALPAPRAAPRAAHSSPADPPKPGAAAALHSVSSAVSLRWVAGCRDINGPMPAAAATVSVSSYPTARYPCR